MGLLKVDGIIDLDQFWPIGESDADTTKVIVMTERDAFEFRPHPSLPFAVTHAFENAKVIGKITKPPIDKKGRIIVRLQGIDAPELHYRPNPIPKNVEVTDTQRRHFKKLNKQYREYLAETATVVLHSLLAEGGNRSLRCTVTTAVEEPNDVFDTFARFVGDIFVEINGREINMNRWLVKEGFAFPTFYSSMSSEEIVTLIADSKQGRQKKESIWKQLKNRIGRFNEKLVYRGKGASFDPHHDIGKIILPKLFRRLCTWTIYHKVGIFSGSFKRYLTETRDLCFLTKEFLDQGPTASTPYFLSDFLKPKGEFKIKPEDIVFGEKPSKLVGLDGKMITTW